MAVLDVRGLHQYFEQGTVNENHALKGINLSLERGEFVAIIGVNQGQILINGKDVTY